MGNTVNRLGQSFTHSAVTDKVTDVMVDFSTDGQFIRLEIGNNNVDSIALGLVKMNKLKSNPPAFFCCLQQLQNSRTDRLFLKKIV